jgi:hypothetical protein
MRRRSWILGVVGATIALTVASAAAATTVVDTHTPLPPMVGENPCRLADTFTLTGFMHSKITFNESNGGSTLFSIESNLQNVKGVTPLGVRYVMTETTTAHLVVDADVVEPEIGRSNNTLVFKIKLTRQGEDGLLLGDDFTMYVHVHTTVNANGIPTATKVEPGQSGCQ